VQRDKIGRFLKGGTDKVGDDFEVGHRGQKELHEPEFKFISYN
jgi:hypothetical protein